MSVGSSAGNSMSSSFNAKLSSIQQSLTLNAQMK